ncbi:protein phosphatase 2C domain-containing protein [Micromonospora mangrovi]|uniref:Protein phosphatase 2C domain-containing protein n=2 Tax=Micromonospora TaxID=1873 RepID=A0AAU8H8G4_9ACTN
MDDAVLTAAALLVAGAAVYLGALIGWPRSWPFRRRDAGHHDDGRAGIAVVPSANGAPTQGQPGRPAPGRAGGSAPEPAPGGVMTSPRLPGRQTPAVRRFVIEPGTDSREPESRLPAQVLTTSGWHGSFFHGTCGTASSPRPTARLTVRGATLRGATHASLGTEGQDAIGAAWDEARSALYVAVADGLGSLPRSGRVAAEAIRATLHLCVHRPPALSFADSGERLFEAIADGMVRSLAADAGVLDGACTLVVAEVLPRFDGAEVTVHGVGDSEAWALYDGCWEPLHHERGGADNATRDLPAHSRPQTRSFLLSPGSVLLLGTDGFAAGLDTGTSPLARGLAEYWRTRPSWLEFVNHVSFVDEYYSDDRSAIGVWIGEGDARD